MLYSSLMNKPERWCNIAQDIGNKEVWNLLLLLAKPQQSQKPKMLQNPKPLELNQVVNSTPDLTHQGHNPHSGVLEILHEITFTLSETNQCYT